MDDPAAGRTGVMRICLLADTHRNHREVTIPSCDLLIHAGDFCRFEERDEETLEDVDAWFAEVPAARVIAVGGNHDFPLYLREFRFDHAEFLEDSGTEFRDLKIYGSPWCPDLVNFAYFAPGPQLRERWRAIPSGIDILVTHVPPHGILDLPTAGNVHLGCPFLRAELDRIRPRLHVFGHVHASHGQVREAGIHFVNAAIARGPAMAPENPATLVEWD